MRKHLFPVCCAFLLAVTFSACNINSDPASNQPPIAPNQSVQEPQVSSNYQKIINLINTISEPSESSSTADYISAHQTEYDELISYGDEALKIMFEIFENGDETGLRGSVMQAACSQILGEEDIMLDASNGKDWYNHFKGHILQIANTSSADSIKENYPLSYNLLNVLDYSNRSYDSSSVMAADEFVTSDGVRLSMTYDEVCAILTDGYETSEADANTKTVKKDGCSYQFKKLTASSTFDAGLPHDDNFYLFSISIPANSGSKVKIARNIKLNDNIFDVLGKFPAKSVTLKKWAEQYVYGRETSENSAVLRYTTSSSSYTLTVKSGIQNLLMAFDKNNNLISMECSLQSK